MKAYWDSGALVETVSSPVLKSRLAHEGGITRTHTLAEVFSAFSGRPHLRVSAKEAAKAVRALAAHLEFTDLTVSEVLNALDDSQSRGVRGGRVHDFLHALAAKKAGADTLLTTDRNDFDGLVAGLTIEQV